MQQVPGLEASRLHLGPSMRLRRTPKGSRSREPHIRIKTTLNVSLKVCLKLVPRGVACMWRLHLTKLLQAESYLLRSPIHGPLPPSSTQISRRAVETSLFRRARAVVPVHIARHRGKIREGTAARIRVS